MTTVLFVCTANQCRSPMAVLFARQALAQREPQVQVMGAGTSAAGARPVTPATAKVMARRGLDASAHRSSGILEALSPEPDLVIGLAREHARTVVEERPEMFPKTFTLKDLVRRATDAGPRGHNEDLASYLSRLGAGRGFSSLAGWAATDEVADPVGQPLAAHERCAAELETLVGALVDHLWPPPRS
ncbi:MAG TPA: hypothetical protein VFW71_13390 [Actinomycetota bacterium]|nr:hypothetical protein [Actinomycetota bacterium]